MKQITSLASLVFLVLIWDQAAAAQDAQTILRQSSETYVRLRTYHFEGQSEIKIAVDDVNYLLRENIEILELRTHLRVISLLNDVMTH